MITEWQLKQVLSYDGGTGIFTRVKKRMKHLAGLPAGTRMPHGYIQIKLGGKKYLAHRLAYLATYGFHPPDMIDHINGDPADNRIQNLRLTTNRENQLNRYSHRLGRLQGCHYNKDDKKWIACITYGGKRKYIGRYDTEPEAHQAYCDFTKRKFGQ